jgi:hypothetical protein
MRELKKIILFILFFGLAVFSTDRLLGFILKELFRTTYSGQFGGKINEYLAMKDTPRVLIMGDSRALNQVDPAYFNTRTFNLGHAGMNQVFHLTLLQLLVSQNKTPGLIVLHVDPQSFENDTVDYSAALYLRTFYESVPEVRAAIHKSGRWEQLKFLFHSYRFNNIVFNLLNNKIRTHALTGKGFIPIPASPGDSARTYITSVENSVDSLRSFNEKGVEPIVKMMEVCRQKKIQLVCFTAPEFFKRNQAGELPLKKEFAELCALKGIVYLDYSQIEKKYPQFRNVNLWNDCFHLNQKGAEDFSKIISAALDSLISVPSSRQLP